MLESLVSRRVVLSAATVAGASALVGCSANIPKKQAAESSETPEVQVNSTELFVADVDAAAAHAKKELSDLAPGKTIHLSTGVNPSDGLYRRMPSYKSDVGKISWLTAITNPDGLTLQYTVATASNAAMKATNDPTLVPWITSTQVAWQVVPDSWLATKIVADQQSWPETLKLLDNPDETILQPFSLTSSSGEASAVRKPIANGVSLEVPPNPAIFPGQAGYAVAYKAAHELSKKDLEG